MTRPFFIVDVFAERPYVGNQLAVVLDADGLSDEAMQSVAAEANYSETAFVTSAPERDGEHRVFPETDLELRIEQGFAVHRPSLVLLRARRVDDHHEVSVGGRVIPIVRGELL